MQSTFIYTVNLLKPYLVQSSNDPGCSVGLRQPVKSIFEFEPEEDLNYFGQPYPFFGIQKNALILPILRLNLLFKI